jgi:RimJ/RimL family protein N-acetyltransferase
VDDAEAARKYVEFRTWQWESDQRYSWAVCDQLLGHPVGEVALKDLDLHNGSAELVVWTAAEHRGRGIAVHAATAVVRFGFGGVDLHRIGYRQAIGNTPSQRVAEKAGFTLEGQLRGAQLVDCLTFRTTDTTNKWKFETASRRVYLCRLVIMESCSASRRAVAYISGGHLSSAVPAAGPPGNSIKSTPLSGYSYLGCLPTHLHSPDQAGVASLLIRRLGCRQPGVPWPVLHQAPVGAH